MVNSYKSILMIGPKLADPKLAGGMIVQFENILESLNEFDVSYDVVDTNTQIYNNLLLTIKAVFFDFLKKFQKYDYIFMLATKNHFIYLAPLFLFLGSLFGKKMCIYKNAGRFDREYKELDFFRKMLVNYTLKNADLVYFETKYLVEYFNHMNQKTYWFPNMRKKTISQYQSREYQKRFAFISLVATEKGIDELLEASNRLDDSFTIDIYGKVFDKKYTQTHFKQYKANFKGVLTPVEVLEKLQQYDVIVLPSYEEGYPGILIESFSFGLPVLATALPSIKEIVSHGENGILVEPKNVDSLYNGFLSFNKENYRVMSKNAYTNFEMFDSFKLSQKFIEQVNRA